MVYAAIIVGIVLTFLIFVALYISDKKGEAFDTGAFVACIISLFVVVEVNLVANIVEDPQPTAMDVYQGKTTLEYTIRDGIKIDSVVVFKNSIYGKEN